MQQNTILDPTRRKRTGSQTLTHVETCANFYSNCLPTRPQLSNRAWTVESRISSRQPRWLPIDGVEVKFTNHLLANQTRANLTCFDCRILSPFFLLKCAMFIIRIVAIIASNGEQFAFELCGLWIWAFRLESIFMIIFDSNIFSIFKIITN